MQNTSKLILLLMGLISIECSAKSECDAKVLSVIEEQEKQISLGNYSVAKSLIQSMEKCTLAPERELEVVKLLANQGDFDSQLKLRNLSVEWLKLLAFRGDKSSMRKYGSYLLDKESKPGGNLEGSCWVLSALVLGDLDSIHILLSSASKNDDQDELFFLEGVSLISKLNPSLFQSDIYVEYNEGNLKKAKKLATQQFKTWRGKLKENKKTFLEEILNESVDLIKSNQKTSERMHVYTGSCNVESRFSPGLKKLFLPSEKD